MTDATILQLSTVVTNSQRLLHLVENIMDSSVMKGNQQIQLQLAPIAIWPIVESTVRLFSTMAMAGVSINIDVPRSLPPIHADEDRVAQILSHLLTNAFKFTIHGSVSVSACVKGDYLDVAVKDTGPGVSKNAIRNVFQPLSSDREAGTGMGMGLSLVHDLVKAHTVRPRTAPLPLLKTLLNVKDPY
jgi:two-component system sensor histidine kinase ChiS